MFLSLSEWQKILAQSSPSLDAIDGHFAIVRWEQNKLMCYTDQLGLRPLYLARIDSNLVVSTRLDWISRFLPSVEIDLEAFGSHWLTFSQLKTASLINGITKLGPASTAFCMPGSTTVTERQCPIAFAAGGSTFPLDVLRAFINPVLPPGERMSLGLSGGIDSRVLLSLLMNSDRPYSVHTFGSSDDPDVQIATCIASKLGVPQARFDESIPSPQECIRLLQDYAIQTCATEPASTALKLRYFDRLASERKVVIDGGFGELSHRQYFICLMMRGRRALRSGNPVLIFPYLRVTRAEIFRDEIVRMMEKNAIGEIESLWTTLLNVDDVGEETFAHVLALRTRVPNWGSYEQSRMDCSVVNFMPFVQPSYLRTVLSLPVSERRNGKLFYRYISSSHPRLAMFPLVKGGTTYPFGLPTSLAYVL